jgi:hypothetical protein
MIPKQPHPDFQFSSARLILVLAGALFLVGATTEDASVLEARRHSIEKLSQSDLNRLKRNYETFLKLPRERREQLVKLNDELQEDAKNGGHLQKLLDQYNAWLFKLSPFDRDNLLNTSDPGERAQMVQKIIQDQQKQRLARSTRVPFIPLIGGRFDAVAPLSSSELDAVLTAVQQSFLNETAKKDVESTASVPRERHLQILRSAMEQLRRERKVGTKIDPRVTLLVNTMLDAIPREAVKSQITSGGSQVPVRRQLGQVIGRSILAEWASELKESPATAAQVEETTNRWLASAKSAEKRETMEKRLQTTQGQNLIAAVSAVQANPRFRRQRPVITWLFRGLALGPLNRAGSGRAAQQSAVGKASERATDDPEKETSSTDQ